MTTTVNPGLDHRGRAVTILKSFLKCLSVGYLDLPRM
jgi:hypothetical protein